MPIKIFHPDHGFVLTGDQQEADALVAKGGKIVIKNKEINSNENEKVEEATEAKLLRPRGRPRINQD